MEKQIKFSWDEIDEEQELMNVLSELGAEIFDKLQCMREAIEASAYADEHPDKYQHYLSDIDEITNKLDNIWHD